MREGLILGCRLQALGFGLLKAWMGNVTGESRIMQDKFWVESFGF